MIHPILKQLLIGAAVSAVIGFGTYHMAVRWIPASSWQKWGNSVRSYSEKTSKSLSGFFRNFGNGPSETRPSATPSESPAPPRVEVKPVPTPPPIVRPEFSGVEGRSAGGRCTSAEYRGTSLKRVDVDPRGWPLVMDQFHAVKKSLLDWLDSRRGSLSAGSFEILRNHVSELRIQRPPSPEEADLSWRGILLYTVDSKRGPMVRVGGGFLTLVSKNAQRARFELARIVAQAWAPCELQRLGVGEKLWEGLLGCLKVIENDACAEGSFSEGGWAVSTALARMIADPGCRLGAFEAGEMQACLTQLGKGQL